MSSSFPPFLLKNSCSSQPPPVHWIPFPLVSRHDLPGNYSLDSMFNFSLRLQTCSFFSFLNKTNKPKPFFLPLKFSLSLSVQPNVHKDPSYTHGLHFHFFTFTTFIHLLLYPRKSGSMDIFLFSQRSYLPSSVVSSGSFHYLTSQGVLKYF